MSERNIVGVLMATLMSGFVEFLEPLKWFMLLAVILILADMRFGIAAAKRRGERIRFSRAGRRTINKFVDYLCWTMLAGALGKAIGEPFGIPLLPVLVLLVVFGFEINSCFNNYFESRGKKMKINFFDLLKKKADIIDIKDESDEITTE